MIPKKLICIENVGQDIEARKQINKIIDYLSDREDPEQIIKAYNDLLDRQHEGEASKGEGETKTPASSSTKRGEVQSLNYSTPPQQEKSRGECDHYFVSDGAGKSCVGCGKHKHDARFPKCSACKPQLKEESPKEDEWLKIKPRLSDSQKAYILGHVNQFYVSKEKIKKICEEEIKQHLETKPKPELFDAGVRAMAYIVLEGLEEL